MVRRIKETLNQLFVDRFFESQIGIVLTVHGGPEKAKGLYFIAVVIKFSQACVMPFLSYGIYQSWVFGL
ncbi:MULTISPECIES: hypothetical protein [unclassified Nostoc]|uniref:hypothetical protein n=1 Tax=unclassified Nostoc TaxID=2593658 RepID=UPI0025D053A8|nr:MULTISPECIES: hypothetical protein [unclassified Nostoc]